MFSFRYDTDLIIEDVKTYTKSKKKKQREAQLTLQILSLKKYPIKLKRYMSNLMKC